MQTQDIIDSSSLPQQTILIAEDNEDDVCIMERAFKRAGIPNPVQVVTNGDQVLDYLLGEAPFGDRKRYPLPAILLLDLKMPRRNGLEVLEWLRRKPGLKHLTAHLLSASSRAVDVTRAGELGANGFLVKPSRFEDLVSMLKAWYSLLQFQAIALPQAPAVPLQGSSGGEEQIQEATP